VLPDNAGILLLPAWYSIKYADVIAASLTIGIPHYGVFYLKKHQLSRRDESFFYLLPLRDQSTHCGHLCQTNQFSTFDKNLAGKNQ